MHFTSDATVDVAQAQALMDLHFAIWNEPDAQRRNALFAQVYTEDFVVADYQAKAVGHAAVGQLLQRVQDQHPGFAFKAQPVNWNHGLGRVTWTFGPPDQPGLIHGEDIFTIRDGKLASAFVFLDPLPSR
nr:nuclear transport factor 2 family protein [Herbaspirillum sp. ASV7]